MTQILLQPFHAYVVVNTAHQLKTKTTYHSYNSQIIYTQHLLRIVSAESWITSVKYFVNVASIGHV